MIVEPVAPAPLPATDVDILVVDDVADNLTAMQALLDREGLNVLTASSGPQALELLLRHEVALVLLDVQMPGMDGFETAELMRGAERTRDVPIIFVTAIAHEATRSFRGYAAGAVDFLQKPVDPRIIESKVAVFVELYRRRRELTHRNAELERALDLNAILSAVLTHDLRSPLSAIAVSAELATLAARRGDADKLDQATRHIKSATRRMAQMIAQLLDFSQVRSGTLRLAPSAVDLRALCAAAIEEVRLANPDAAIEVEQCGSAAGRFDADRMMQVFGNLLGNAVEHGAGRSVRVRLDGRDAASVHVEVSNAGELPDEVRARLFMPFRARFDHTRRSLGLGLYIVEQFVRAHGGTVSADSSQGRTTFSLELPRG